MNLPRRRGRPFAPGELDVILSLTPTRTNIERLSHLLERSEGAIETVYIVAYDPSRLQKVSVAMKNRVRAAKDRLGLCV
jgi:hypothetical protein